MMGFATCSRKANDADVLARLRIEPARRREYDALARFHYRGGSPGVITSVLRLAHDEPTVVGRFLHRRGESETIAVLVRSLPALACRMRDLATRDRYRAGGRRGSAFLLNREVRTISRVVVDPRWRGLGLAARLVRHALEHPEREELVYSEALAAMARVHPFFERAGMTRYETHARTCRADSRLLDALDSLGIPPREIVSARLIRARLDAVDDRSRAWLRRELRRWRNARGGETRQRAPSRSKDDAQGKFESDLAHARTRLLARPVYFLFDHRADPPADPAAHN